jgi:hypothetical protein
MSHKHVQLEINNHKIAIAVLTNDVLVFTNRYHQAPLKELSINQWVTGGSNSFKINISINPNWFEELKEQSFNMVIALFEGCRGDFTKTVLKEIHWKYSEDTQFPVIINENIEIDIPYGNWTWYDADILSEENFNFDSLKQYLTQLHSKLHNKDYDNLTPFLKSKSTELAAAYGIPIHERMSDQKTFFLEELFTTPNWGLVPIDTNNLLIQYHANGRLIQVLNKNGTSPLQSNTMTDNVTFSLDLFLCHKNGEWILCR